MINTLISILKNNVSILLSIISSASSFFVNIFLKGFLSADAYGDFSLIFFAVNTIFILGMVGYDQVLIKYSNSDNGYLVYERNVVKLGVCVFLFSPFLSVFILTSLSILENFSFLYMLISLIATFLVVNSILFNLSGDLSSSYFYIGFWRFVLLMSVLYMSVFHSDYRRYDVVIFFSMLLTVFAFYFKRPNIIVKNENKTSFFILLTLLMSSLFSLTSYQFFEGLDRIIINSHFDKSVFGDYFFLFSTILAPVSVICTYNSAKKLVAYKDSISISQVKKDFYHSLFLSFTIAMIVGGVVLFLIYIGFLQLLSIDFQTLILVILLCTLRGGYSILSMAYKVVAKSKTLFFSSIFFLVISLLVFFILKNLNYDLGIKSMIISICLLWLLRCLAYIFIVENDIKGNFKCL